MKNSFGAIICCLLGALVLSAAASHIKSKPKPAVKSFEVSLNEKELLAPARNGELEYTVQILRGTVMVMMGDFEHPREDDQGVRMSAGPTERNHESFTPNPHQDLYVLGLGPGDRKANGECYQCEAEVSKTDSSLPR